MNYTVILKLTLKIVLMLSKNINGLPKYAGYSISH